MCYLAHVETNDKGINFKFKKGRPCSIVWQLHLHLPAIQTAHGVLFHNKCYFLHALFLEVVQVFPCIRISSSSFSFLVWCIWVEGKGFRQVCARCLVTQLPLFWGRLSMFKKCWDCILAKPSFCVWLKLWYIKEKRGTTLHTIGNWVIKFWE